MVHISSPNFSNCADQKTFHANLLEFIKFLGLKCVSKLVAITTNTHTLRYYMEPMLGGQTPDLSDIFFMAKIRVTTEDDKQIPDDTEVSTINMSLFSALKTMKLYINEYVFSTIRLLYLYPIFLFLHISHFSFLT